MVRYARLAPSVASDRGLNSRSLGRLLVQGIAAVCTAAAVHAADSPFVGRWALDLPDGEAGWLGVEPGKPGLSARILWGGGSPVAVDEASDVDGVLRLTWNAGSRRGAEPRRVSAVLRGEVLELTTVLPGASGGRRFVGKKIPDPPPPPDLSKVEYGAPVRLLPAADLSGWEKVRPDAFDGWKLEDGVLSNRVSGVKGRRGANLRTRDAFEDFRLTTDVRPLKGGNSGVYLRGVYEIQVADSFGKPLDVHHMGALYGREAPSVEAAKPAGEWQKLEIVLVDRHVTVVLNGKKVVDNRPALGCTGGALTSDEFKPGPLVLQGDHSDVDYRDMTLFPVIKHAVPGALSK